MTRIPTPATINDAPAASLPLLEAVKKQLGIVPNLFRSGLPSPAALQGYLGLSGALGEGALPAATRERIALAVAEINGCDYCLSAHTYLGRNLAKLDDAEIAANRNGASNDPKGRRRCPLRCQGRAQARPRERRRRPRRKACRLRRRADDRDRAARRAQYLDELRQRGRQDRHRLPGRERPEGGGIIGAAHECRRRHYAGGAPTIIQL